MLCVHLGKSDEAYSVTEKFGVKREEKITVHLCCFPDNYPEKFSGMPRWLLRTIGSGLAIEPTIDCVNCPAFSTKIHDIKESTPDAINIRRNSN